MGPHILRGKISKNKPKSNHIFEGVLQDQAQNVKHPKCMKQQKPGHESFSFCISLLSNCSLWNVIDIIENNTTEKWELFPHCGFFPQLIQFELLIHCQMCNHRLCDNHPLPAALNHFLLWHTGYAVGLYLAQVEGFLGILLMKEPLEMGKFKPLWHNILNNLKGQPSERNFIYENIKGELLSPMKPVGALHRFHILPRFSFLVKKIYQQFLLSGLCATLPQSQNFNLIPQCNDRWFRKNMQKNC